MEHQVFDMAHNYFTGIFHAQIKRREVHIATDQALMMYQGHVDPQRLFNATDNSHKEILADGRKK